mgnify:CR=1 FL=1
MVLLASQILLLGSIAYQDFKSRAVSWMLLPVLLLLAVFSVMDSIQFAAIESLKSFTFLLLQFVLVYSYFVIKFKTFKFQFVDGLLGKGDILFLLAIIPFFTFKSYVIYYSLSMVFALIAHVIAQLVNNFLGKGKLKLIPLLGWIGLFYIGVFVLEYYGVVPKIKLGF